MDGHGIQLRDEPRHVEIAVDDVTVASTDQAVTLEETGLPLRYYVPRDDVRMEHLEATTTETVCPFKGQASYWNVRVSDAEHRDLAWSYEQPIAGVEKIAGFVCFYAEHTDLAIDGVAQERPESPWSKIKI
jgi:uncharacterized protein (DUF427 family)